MAADTGDKIAMTVRFESPDERTDFLNSVMDHNFTWSITHGKTKLPVTIIETHPVR